MATAVLFDCEFLTGEGASSRFWCGPHDPDPIVVQIGAVKLDLFAEFQILSSVDILVQPRDRHGRPHPLDSFFTRLTGIDQSTVNQNGLELHEALAAFAQFAGASTIWS